MSREETLLSQKRAENLHPPVLFTLILLKVFAGMLDHIYRLRLGLDLPIAQLVQLISAPVQKSAATPFAFLGSI
jgi:hypothetical protein